MMYAAERALHKAIGAEDLAAELVADASHLLRESGDSNSAFIAARLNHMLVEALLHAQSHRQEVEEYIRDLNGQKS